MKTNLFALLAFTMLAGPALAQAPSPQPDQQAPGASPVPMMPMQHPPAGGGHAGHGAPPPPSQATMPAMDQTAMQRMMQDMMPAPNDSTSTKAFKAADMKMMHNMAVPYTGDADVDLRTKMIPHHQGAIDMARVALADAKDPETTRMAQKIIDDQEREIAEMRDWLRKHGK